MKVPACLTEIAPTWAYKIRKAKKLTDLFRVSYGLDMNDNRLCLVGEARLFNDDYTQYGSRHCSICTNFADAFAWRIRKDSATYCISEKLKDLSYSELIDAFCKHMKQKHKKDVKTTLTQESQS